MVVSVCYLVLNPGEAADVVQHAGQQADHLQGPGQSVPAVSHAGGETRRDSHYTGWQLTGASHCSLICPPVPPDPV